MSQKNPHPKFLGERQVLGIVRVPKWQLDALISAGCFPRPVLIPGTRQRGWLASEVFSRETKIRITAKAKGRP